MQVRLPILLLLLALFGNLVGCEKPQSRAKVPDEPWSADVEKTFQDAEAMRYSVEQWKAEKQELEKLGQQGAAPRSPQR